PVAQPALSTPSRPRLAPHSFPTRRSSDLGLPRRAGARKAEAGPPDLVLPDGGRGRRGGGRVHGPPGPRPLPRLLGAEPGARGRPGPARRRPPAGSRLLAEPRVRHEGVGSPSRCL